VPVSLLGLKFKELRKCEDAALLYYLEGQPTVFLQHQASKAGFASELNLATTFPLATRCYTFVMALIYITGNAGVGKSTICKEFQKRGYDAHDIDEDGITAWYDKITGEQVNWPRDASGRSKEWFDKHAFKMVPARIQQFAKAAKNKTIFLCGQSIHDHEIWDLFDQIIYMAVDKQTLKNRLATRTTNEFGKTPAELEHILAVHDSFQEKHEEHGAITIDAGKSLGEIVDKILSIC
jgi:dephospho-CoA kinase